MTTDPQTPTPAALSPERVRGLLEGITPGEWQLWTSCSWRRFRTDTHAIVCEPYVAHDGHPDLQVRDTDAQLIAAAPALARAYLDALSRAEAAEARLEEVGAALLDWSRRQAEQYAPPTVD